MPERTRQNLVLIGFMGSGKSTIGRLVARRMGFQFLDTDQLIVDRVGMAIPDLFALRGETAFRALETSVLESLAHLNRCVIATGGGAVVREQNRATLRQLGFVVGLTASEAVLFERVSRNSKRPLLQGGDPLATVQEMLARRAPFYADAAQWTIDTSTLSHEQAVTAIIAEARRAFAWQRVA